MVMGLWSPAAVNASILPANPTGPIVVVDFNGLNTFATNAQVQSYLNNALAAGGYAGTVTVTGAIGGGNYTGDQHVVGPVSGANSGTPTVTSQTLATLDNGNFIRTSADRIVLSLSQPIYGISLDMQIFPEANNTPDFTFLAYQTYVNSSNNVPIAISGPTHFVGVVPGLPGFVHSPDSGPTNHEPFMQLLLVNSPLLVYSFPDGATRLEFVDWPPTIGVDNTVFILGAPAEVPEPGTAMILGLALATVGFGAFFGRGKMQSASVHQPAQV